MAAKKPVKVYDLQSVIAETLAKNADIGVTLSDGATVHLKRPHFWSADTLKAAELGDVVTVAECVFREADGWQRFQADGGTALLVDEILRRENGATLPE